MIGGTQPSAELVERLRTTINLHAREDFGVFEYRGVEYPSYIRDGNAACFIAPVAAHFCNGTGYDVGSGKWPVQIEAVTIGVDILNGGNAMQLPGRVVDFVFSSHCLEHLDDPIAALKHWMSRIRNEGTLFLYLPHPDMEYWRPENNLKHRHIWYPERMEEIFLALGLRHVVRSERDGYWSFFIAGQVHR